MNETDDNFLHRHPHKIFNNLLFFFSLVYQQILNQPLLSFIFSFISLPFYLFLDFILVYEVFILLHFGVYDIDGMPFFQFPMTGSFAEGANLPKTYIDTIYNISLRDGIYIQEML